VDIRPDLAGPAVDLAIVLEAALVVGLFRRSQLGYSSEGAYLEDREGLVLVLVQVQVLACHRNLGMLGQVVELVQGHGTSAVVAHTVPALDVVAVLAVGEAYLDLQDHHTSVGHDRLACPCGEAGEVVVRWPILQLV
jgi:hypothetical protein